MIYEFRTYSLRPGTLPRFLQLFGDALPKRLRLSPLAAFWHTDTGPLNQVIHVWPYENGHERTRIRAEAVKDGSWPPKTGELITHMRADIFEQMPFSPPLTPSASGRLVEICVQTVRPFSLPAMTDLWTTYPSLGLPAETLTGVFVADVGELNRWMHVWSYRDLDERDRVKHRLLAAGLWPARNDAVVIEEESKLLRPAVFLSG